METLSIKEKPNDTNDSAPQETTKKENVLVLQLESSAQASEFDKEKTKNTHTYFLPASSAAEVLQTIRAILERESKVLPGNLRELVEKNEAPPIETLTRREKEVLQLVVKGLTNRQIGDKLFISPKTVDCHRTNMMRKLDVHNVAELVRLALDMKLSTDLYTKEP